jgi:hypothetical protein
LAISANAISSTTTNSNGRQENFTTKLKNLSTFAHIRTTHHFLLIFFALSIYLVYILYYFTLVQSAPGLGMISEHFLNNVPAALIGKVISTYAKSLANQQRQKAANTDVRNKQQERKLRRIEKRQVY